jgi:hypothetical protein
MNQVQDYSRYITKNNYLAYPDSKNEWDDSLPQNKPGYPGCQQDGNTETSRMIQQETNTRIFQRILPSQLLQPYIDVRPVSTKYSLLPVVDPRAKTTVPYVTFHDYNVATTFNPGDRASPWSGFSSNVNIESELRNQVFALQKCNQAVYVPSTMSDLYDTRIISRQKNVEQPFPHLFELERFNDFNPNPENIGQHVFLNNTRMEFRDKTTTC